MREKKSVLALGFFDGLHLGHAALIERAKDLADRLGAESAILTFDNHPDTYVKGVEVELISSAADRRIIAGRFFGIDKVYFIHFNRDTMRMPWTEFVEDVIANYAPAHFVVGYDFSFGYRGEGTAEKLRDYCRGKGIGCDIIDQVTLDGIPVSSTYIRTLLMEGDIETANRFLGHPYLLTDTVRTGFRLGRKMEFPTVNMRFSEGVLIPRHGVYVSRVLLPGGEKTGVTNIGVRPTFDGDRVTVETHILDFDADLYGQQLGVELHSFLRDEVKFSSQEELAAQIKLDARAARKFFDNK